jgi:mRNA interferase RelE/StbE
MRYRIEFLPSALEQVRALPRNARRLIGEKLDRAENDLTGDIKKLKGFRSKYRLRAGNYRVLFELEGSCLVVYSVGDRKDIYEERHFDSQIVAELDAAQQATHAGQNTDAPNAPNRGRHRRCQNY